MNKIKTHLEVENQLIFFFSLSILTQEWNQAAKNLIIDSCKNLVNIHKKLALHHVYTSLKTFFLQHLTLQALLNIAFCWGRIFIEFSSFCFISDITFLPLDMFDEASPCFMCIRINLCIISKVSTAIMCLILLHYQY